MNAPLRDSESHPATSSSSAPSVESTSSSTESSSFADRHTGSPILPDSPGGSLVRSGEETVIREVVDPHELPAGISQRIKTFLIGRPRDLTDSKVFHHVSLIAFLAWVGLGADGLSSSCYGPAEAFHHLGEHSYLAIFLSLATILTVVIISACYSHIIEEFPSGGGGYLVASKLLGPRVGVVSGSALLVDYVLTVTVSIAAAGDALFGLLPTDWQPAKLTCEVGAIVLLIVLNLRGVKESVTALLPIFILFLITHAILIVGSISLHMTAASDVAAHVSSSVQSAVQNPDIGLLGLVGVFFYAYSLGAGTYTGIEAVSNSMPVMREPKVATAKRTMIYMAASLAFMAGGLMIAYLLLGIESAKDRTMNQVLTETFLRDIGLGSSGLGAAFLWITVISEGTLLYVAAQAGFIDGPRVLANMAQDSYLPHWLGNLSERLSTHNGIVFMGGSALAALVYTQGNVSTLVIMYSINVFLTFSLSMIAMCRYWWNHRRERTESRRRLALFVVGALLCLGILGVTIYEKFLDGGYVTLGVTGVCVAACLATRRYYDDVGRKIRKLNDSLDDLPTRPEDLVTTEPDAQHPTAIILVGGYSGLGIHTLLNSIRFAPGYFKNLVFVSVGVVDSGSFKGEHAMEQLQQSTADTLSRYVDLANRLGFPSSSFMAIGTDPVEELEHLCVTVHRRFPKSVIFAGQLVFRRESVYQRFFHNQTAFSLQRRLQWDGVPMMILPTRIR